ncbi:MAG: hypothetical protein K0S81_1857, partial [Rhodospirillales bacterium]|nr:hypothetical protein [Rhodospirillales bacterium]
MVPVQALFRQVDDWAEFVMRGGRAYTTALMIGDR